MKIRWFLFIFIALCLTACGNQGEQSTEEAFTLTIEKQKEYEQQINDTLYSFYWRYDENSISYFDGIVPSKSNEKNAIISEVSEQCGYQIKDYGGKPAVIATVKLIHFNGNEAGLAYFYFVKDKLAGVYYTGGYDNDIYSLKDRNVYVADGGFKQFETEKEMGNFSQRKTNFPINGFCTNGKDESGNNLIAEIENNVISIYRYKNYSFSRYKRIYLQEGDLIPLSAVFLPDEKNGDTMAVLMCRFENIETVEGSSRTIFYSEKVVFLDSQFNKTQEEILLPSTSYTCLGAEGNQLVMVNGNTLEYYNKMQEGWNKVSQFYLGHGVNCFKVADLDHNDVKEYLMTDGMDFYMYQKMNTGFKLIWRTHLSIQSLMGYIYTGDLNRDGTDEIYVCDNTGTAIRYILTKKGLVSKNEDISYGDRIYALDFDGDEIDDYVKIIDIEKMQQFLYSAQE